jgi:hypothetical protein
VSRHPKPSVVTLPLFCPHCGGAITLQFGDWQGEDEPLISQLWSCPYCSKENVGEFPGRLAWVAEGHEDPPNA